jgi:very-short-patch-repair endonuclease
MRLDKALLVLAADQRSCVGFWQARDLGASQTEIGRLRRSTLWMPMGKRVLLVAGTTRDQRTDTSAAVLAAGPGAVLSHTSAAALWDLPGYNLLPATLSQVAGRAWRRGPLGMVHDLVVVPSRWTTTLDGIRVVRPELAVYQLCATVHPDRAARTFDTAWAKHLLSGASGRACLDDLAASGRDGTTVYRSILDVRGRDYVPPTNNLEGRMAQLATQAGINLRRQVELGGETWDGRVDFVEDDVRLVVEVQSERYHSALCDRMADEMRRQKLEDDGFYLLELWDNDIWTRSVYAISRLRQAAREAKMGRLLPSKRHTSVSF